MLLNHPPVPENPTLIAYAYNTQMRMRILPFSIANENGNIGPVAADEFRNAMKKLKIF